MKKLSLAAIAAVAYQGLADPQSMPHKPFKAFLSNREIFGLESRVTDGYHPTQSICGIGATCAEACGDGYSQCASSDNQMHCYDTKTDESCCSDGTGNSCDAGYYCSADSSNQTWCCPEGMDLETCASKYQVTGSLHTDSTTLTSSTTSSTIPVVSSTSSTSSAASTTPSETSTSSPSVTGGSFFEAVNSTAVATSGSGSHSRETATASGTVTSTGSTSGASTPKKAGSLVLFGAAALVPLL